MQKKAFVLHVSVALALCAMGLAAPAAAGEVPTGSPIPRGAPVPSLPHTFAGLDAIINLATSRQSGGAPGAVAASPSPTVAPPRAAALARSYPRNFSTYDGLADYAISVAAAQQTLNDRLATLLTREDAARATLATVFDPRLRGGLLRSRDDLIDEATIQALETQVAGDVIAARQLVADGAVVPTSASWQLPLLGEDTQDFGPTPYYYEPALTYGGVYYPHFHTGTDIATAWGTPVLAPAHGVVVFAGTMGDGAEVVVLAHDSGLVSMYAHLDNHVFPVPVKVGDAVDAGERIGNVGLTGMTTGAHLHWSVWRNGELIDPLSMIRG
jgi:murein DD-endopeptidase MepM/ murein hydrolase activator NlpD